MTALEEKRNKNKRIMIVFACLFAVGLPMLIVGGVMLSSSAGWWGMMGVGIACVVLGFYGTPVSWAAYDQINRKLRIVCAVEFDAIYDVAVLAQRFRMRPKQMAILLNELIAARAIVGFTLNRELMRLERNTYDPAVRRDACEYCGAVIVDPSILKCPFCGATIIH